MEVLNQLLATLGTPILLKRIGAKDRPGAVVARWRFAGGVVDVDAPDAARILMCLSGTQTVKWELRGRSAKRRIDAGSVSVMSPSEPPRVTIQGDVDVFQVLLDPALIKDATFQSDPRIRSLFDSPQDRFRRPVLQALVAATRDEPDDRLLLGSIVHGLAEQLATSQHEPGEMAIGGLAPLGRRRVVELIHDRLETVPDEPPGLDDLASAAGLSVHHFIKAFRSSMGITPYAFALRCRLQRSMHLLAQRRMTVAESAYHTGFGSPAHFVSSFRRHNGITPGAFRAALLG